MSTSLLNSLVDSVQEDFGFPAGLARSLNQQPWERVELSGRKQSINIDDLPQWHQLARQDASMSLGFVKGWRSRNGFYSAEDTMIPALNSIGIRVEHEGWECDISAVEGLASSRYGLSQFESLEELVTQDAPQLIEKITDEALRENLAHSGVRIVNDPKTSDCFVTHSWDRRVFLSNAGGSHHFAAAQYIAKRLGQRVPIRGRRVHYLLNHSAVREIYSNYEIFASSFTGTFGGPFFDGMKDLRASWSHFAMPSPFEKHVAVLLPRRESRSARVAKLMHEVGATDLGRHLLNLPVFPH
ncbi:DUF6685 family protein [Comamonas testosteroni]|jgi:hypothetical protein|uniref:DUF6685 family protein n=1 Tax=Comamonas testosteroni TaxID=285 RepID=UPI0026F1A699|nr:DUF6685 family protein [Comamonas testosteroni]